MIRFTLTLSVAFLLLGCSAPNRGVVTQVSTIDALLAGVYDGDTRIGQLARYGDTGIGTFTRLDGEMVIHKGVVYQIKADGSVHLPPPETTTPFATVVPFTPTKETPLPGGADKAGVYRFLDAAEPNRNVFVAVVIEGTFRSIRARSVPAQDKPYEPLADIIGAQSNFEFGGDDETVEGVLVGFRCPPYVKGLNVPGYHLHFLSADRKRGGHIIDFVVNDAIARWQPAYRYAVILPRTVEHFGAADLEKDRADELEKVEQ